MRCPAASCLCTLNPLLVNAILQSSGLLLALHTVIRSADLSTCTAQLALHHACHLHSLCLLLPGMRPEGSPVRPCCRSSKLPQRRTPQMATPTFAGLRPSISMSSICSDWAVRVRCAGHVSRAQARAQPTWQHHCTQPLGSAAPCWRAPSSAKLLQPGIPDELHDPAQSCSPACTSQVASGTAQ